jgi:O-antigen/teichoic acid export membrane protein
MYVGAGQFARVALTGAYFVLLARALGVSSFGAFAAAAALVSIAVPFAGLGATTLIVKSIARNPQSSALQWANAWTVVVLSGLALTGIVTALAVLLAPATVPLWAVAAIGFSELVLARLVDLAAVMSQVRGRVRRTAAFIIYLYTSRLALALILVASPVSVTTGTWSLMLLLATLPVSTALFVYTSRDVGRARPSLVFFLGQWREGLLYSASLSAQTVHNDADKTMTAKLASSADAGIYTAAYRVIDMGYTPVRALLSASFPRLFALGEAGTAGTLPLIRKMARPALAYATVVGIAIYASADLLPLLLGPSFAASTEALRLMALVPLLRSAHSLAADSLTCSGHQGARTIAQISIALANVGLNLILIPQYGYHGAIASTLACEAVLAIALWVVLLVTVRRESRVGELKTPRSMS